MKKIIHILLLAAIPVCIADCDGKEDPVKGDSLTFDMSEILLQLGNFKQLEVYSVSGGQKDLVNNSDLEWSCDAPDVLSVTEGILKGLNKGVANVKAAYGDMSASLKVTVRDGQSITGIDAAFTADNMYDMGHLLTGNAGFQQFDIDKDGNIYYATSSADYYKILVDKVVPSKGGSDKVEATMTFYYSGHLTGMSVEDAADGTYIWIPEYAGKNTSESSSQYKEYWGMQTIGRVKFENGKKVSPDDPSIEHFWLGNTLSTMNVAVDPDHDIIAFCFHDPQYGTGNDGTSRRIRMYKLSEVMALPLEDCTLKERTYGGDGAPDASQVTHTPTIKARNVLKLTPVAEIGTPNKGKTPDDICYYAWQGFDVYDGKVYFVEGTAVKNMGGSRAALTIWNYDGTLYEPRSFVRVVQNASDLSRFGITETGAMESEGVKAWNGNLYLGFNSWGYKGSNAVRGNVFKYDLPE